MESRAGKRKNSEGIAGTRFGGRQLLTGRVSRDSTIAQPETSLSVRQSENDIMTSCTIIGLVVSCSIDAGTRLPPADAAAKMQAPFVYVAPAEMLWWDDRPVYYDRSWPFSKESRQLTLGYRVRTQSPRERRRR